LEDEDPLLYQNDNKALRGRSGFFEQEGKRFFKTKTKTRDSNNFIQKTQTKNRFRQTQQNQRLNDNVDCDFYTSDICLQVNNYPM
jgi:hypothetical protein